MGRIHAFSKNICTLFECNEPGWNLNLALQLLILSHYTLTSPAHLRQWSKMLAIVNFHDTTSQKFVFLKNYVLFNLTPSGHIKAVKNKITFNGGSLYRKDILFEWWDKNICRERSVYSALNQKETCAFYSMPS